MKKTLDELRAEADTRNGVSFMAERELDNAKYKAEAARRELDRAKDELDFAEWCEKHLRRAYNLEKAALAQPFSASNLEHVLQTGELPKKEEVSK